LNTVGLTDVRLLRREGESGEWSRTLVTEGNATFMKVPELKPFTTYAFKVSARNSLGYSVAGRESYPTMTHRERKFEACSSRRRRHSFMQANI